MPETEDGLNSLAAAKVKEGGKKMGSNMFIKYPLVARHRLTHSVIMK